MDTGGDAFCNMSSTFPSCHNLISVTRAIESGKTVKFSKTGCEFKKDPGQITAVATKQGSLYHLKMCSKSQECLKTIVSENRRKIVESKIWMGTLIK